MLADTPGSPYCPLIPNRKRQHLVTESDHQPLQRSAIRTAARDPRHALRVLWWLAKGYWYKWTYRVRGIRFEAGRHFRVQGRLVVRGPGRVVFGDNVLVGVGRTTPWTHAADAIIKVGDNTILNGTRFGAARLIEVGPNCLLGDGQILDTDFHSIRADRRKPGVPVRVDPVIIGENVWIGASCGVLPGTTIGRNSVVGYGSVCAGVYPADSLIAGNRARVIKPLPTADTEHVAAEAGTRASAPQPRTVPPAIQSPGWSKKPAHVPAAAGGPRMIAAMNGFRGFAVINIVLVQALPLYLLVLSHRYGPNYSLPAFRAFWQVLFYGSTIYFAIVLGVWFSAHLAREKWRSYFRAQALLVLAPYALLSLFFTLFTWDVDRGLVRTAYDDIWQRWIVNTISGKAVFTYWYVPVLLTLAALTPVLSSLARRAHGRWGLLLLALAPLVISRTGRAVSAETIVYFAGAYCIGLWFGTQYDYHMARLARLRIPLLAVAVISSIALALLPASIEAVGTTSIRESLFYIQKVCASGVAILVFQRLAAAVPRLLDAVARHAYAIYLLYIVIFQVLVGGMADLLPRPDTAMAIGQALLVAGVAVIASLFAIRWIQRILGSYSRQLIGI